MLTAPPFQFVSTASQSFLAKLRLEWVGPEQAGVEVDHWVSVRLSQNYLFFGAFDAQVFSFLFFASWTDPSRFRRFEGRNRSSTLSWIAIYPSKTCKRPSPRTFAGTMDTSKGKYRVLMCLPQQLTAQVKKFSPSFFFFFAPLIYDLSIDRIRKGPAITLAVFPTHAKGRQEQEKFVGYRAENVALQTGCESHRAGVFGHGEKKSDRGERSVLFDGERLDECVLFFSGDEQRRFETLTCEEKRVCT
jgi:hypothetical protein